MGLGAAYAMLATVLVHGGLAASIMAIRQDDAPKPATVITIREPKPAPTPPPPPPPPPQQVAPQVAPAPAPKPAPKRAAPTPKPAAAPAAAPAAPAAPLDFGTKLGGAGGSGPALPAPSQAPPPETAAPVKPVPKNLAKPAEPAACAEALIEPKPISVAQPAFTQDAIDAGIAGKVRVEITISATGEITGARVIEGLGHGLDEAALAAARASTFQPATRCGQPTATTFVIGMRFAQP